MGDKKEKKEMSKGMRIFVVVLLSILFIYFSVAVIFSIGELFSELSKGGISVLFAYVLILTLAILCGYELRKNILKLIGKDKKELTAEQLQKKKKKNIIIGVCGVVVFVFTILGFNLYSNYITTNEKEQMISKIKEYQNNGYLELSDKEYQELEMSSNTEIKERLDNIEENIKLQKEYNEKFSAKLDEIFEKEINVELYQSEDNYYMYIPFNTSTGESYSKAQVECVTIYDNSVYDIYYYVEMELTVINKYNGLPVSRGRTKKYYKVENINELNKTIKINAYKGLEEELMNIIKGNTTIIASPSENNNYKYFFHNVQQ